MNLLTQKPGVAARSNASIRRRIAVVFCAGALLTAGVLAALLVQLRSNEIVEVGKLLTAVAQLTDEQTSRTLQSVESTVRSVDKTLSAAALSAAFPSVVTGGVAVNPDSINDALHKFVADRPYLLAIWVLDERGYTTYGSDPGFAGLDFSDRPYFTGHRGNPKAEFEFGVPVRNRVTNKWFIPAVRTVRSVSGDFAGVIVAAVDPLFFSRVWTLDKELPNLSVTLFRADGVMLMRSPVDEQLIGTSYSNVYVFRQVAAGFPTGTFQRKSAVDGEMRLFAYRQLTVYPGMVLVIGQGLDQVLEPWWTTLKIIVSGWIVALLALGWLTLWLAREGQRRRATQERYRLLFDASPFPTAAIDRATRRFLAVSDAAVEHYGWSREEFLAMSSDDLYPPEDLIKVRAMRLNEKPGVVSDMRGLRHHKKDGTLIDVSMILRRSTSTAGPASWRPRPTLPRSSAARKRARMQTPPARSQRRRVQWPKSNSASRRRWKRSGSSPAASHTTSTTS